MKPAHEFDYLIVGSGASGATAAVVLSEQGYRVGVIEEGKWHRTADFKEDLFTTIHTLFRGAGMQVATGSAVMPVLEGKCVGGSTVLNGAIVHRFPDEIYESWAQEIPDLRRTMSWEALQAHAEAIELDLGIKRNWESLLPYLPAAQALQKLGWEHHAMLRNAPGCQGSGRCLQGCPTAGKWSMELSYLPRAKRAGAEIFSEMAAKKIHFVKDRAVGVVAQSANGEAQYFAAKRGVIVACGVVQTPLLLSRSGIKNAWIGKNFQTHLGIGIVARMPKPAKEYEGPPQGIEVTSFRKAGFKLATQLVPLELLLSRTPLVGSPLAAAMRSSSHYSSWMASIQSDSTGRVSTGLLGKPKIQFEPSKADLTRSRVALHSLAVLLFEMGAEVVYPGVSGAKGAPIILRNADEAKSILELPNDPRSYWLSAGHLFGTARLGVSEENSVVGTDFRVHGTKNCFVIDASVFPSNLGVNPQHSIMSVARHGAVQIGWLEGN